LECLELLLQFIDLLEIEHNSTLDKHEVVTVGDRGGVLLKLRGRVVGHCMESGNTMSRVVLDVGSFLELECFGESLMECLGRGSDWGRMVI